MPRPARGRFRVELYDRDGTHVEELDNEAEKITWEWSRIGGCGSFGFSLPRKFDAVGNISLAYEVRILQRSGLGTHTLWYSGLVEDRSADINGTDEIVRIKGFGFASQLEVIHFTKTYTSTEISAIVKDILDTFVTGDTDITYDAGDVVNTGYTVDSIEFDTSAQEAITTLADLAGTREWGVGADKKFFFKARSETLNDALVFSIGDVTKQASELDSFRRIRNRLILEGGDVGGSKYTRTVTDAASKLKWKLRVQKVFNSAIVTDDVADQYLDSLLSEVSEALRRASTRIVDLNEVQVEATIPIGLAAIQTPGVRYNEELYGTFLYSGKVVYQVRSVKYSLDDNESLIKHFELGQLRPKDAELLDQLQHDLDQLAAART